jgi:hypothetical protein
VPLGVVIRRLITEAECIDALPGWGKTTYIRNNCNDGDIIIARTSMAVRVLREKILPTGKHVKIMSVEAINMLTGYQVNDVWVDESTMIDFSDLVQLWTMDIRKLHLLGDSSQVGAVDMSQTPGVRHNLSLMSRVPRANRQTHRVTRRMGAPMTDRLIELLPGLVTESDHGTGFQHVQLTSDDIQGLQQAVIDYNPNVILCFHQSTKKFVLERITTEALVQTVHAYQGKEVYNCLVIQRPVHGRWGLCGSSNYLISALTRASSNTTLVTMGYNRHVENLSELVEVIGGAPIADSSWVNYTWREAWKLTDEELREVQSHLSNIKAANVSLTKHESSVQLVIKRSLVTIANITITQEDFRVECRIPNIRSRLMNMEDQPISGIVTDGEEQESSSSRPDWHKQTVTLPWAGLTRLRVLLWIIDMLDQEQILPHLTSSGTYYMTKWWVPVVHRVSFVE